MSTRTVKVINVSFSASEHDMKEFFSFSGEIEYVEMHSDNERSQVAYVTFKAPLGAETAVLLSGATIVDQSVIIALDPDQRSATDPDYTLPYDVAAEASELENTAGGEGEGGGAESAVQRAEDVVSSMLVRGFILGKDTLNKAKAFDERHQFTSTATATYASLDQKIGLTEKISAGTTIVRDLDEKYQVSEMTKSAFAAAEQTVSTVGSVFMRNRYVLTGASWVMGAFDRVAKAAEDVGQKTKEKIIAEEKLEQKTEDRSESPKAAEGLIL